MDDWPETGSSPEIVCIQPDSTTRLNCYQPGGFGFTCDFRNHRQSVVSTLGIHRYGGLRDAPHERLPPETRPTQDVARRVAVFGAELNSTHSRVVLDRDSRHEADRFRVPALETVDVREIGQRCNSYLSWPTIVSSNRAAVRLVTRPRHRPPDFERIMHGTPFDIC